MSFSASQNNINEILSRNSEYLIPKNQRKYVWGESEWAELFEDVFLIDQTKNYSHFIGSFVFSKSKNLNEYYIVDGQQRLITISVLMCCMANELFSVQENKFATSLIETYLKGIKDGDDYYKITRDDGVFFLTCIIDELKKGTYILSDKIQSIFRDNFEQRDKYNKRIYDCFIYFKKRIKDYIEEKKKSKKETIVTMKNKLTSCECIEIIVESDVEGYRVFETLNARGIPLEQHELIKNYLYSYLRSKEKIKALDTKWEMIINNVVTVKTDYFSTFLAHYCTHLYGKTKKNEEYKIIRSHVQKNKVDELLNSIYKNSIYYSYIINPEKFRLMYPNNYSVYVSLKFFYNLNIRQIRPLLLSLFEAFDEKQTIDEAAFTKSISLLENFYFIFVSLLKGTTNQIDKSINSLATKISSFNYLIKPDELIKEELSKYISENDKIKLEFLTIGYSNKNPKFNNSSNKKCINYIFEKIEKSLDSFEERADTKISSIEHILNDSENLDYTAYIGNLLPLSTRINNNIANKQFADKIDFYKKSKMLTVQKFIEYHKDKVEWTESDIKKRGEWLYEYCFKNIWVF